MSLVNAYVEPERALVAVDTDADGGVAAMSKLVPLVHLNAVLGFRGVSLFQQGVAAQCFLAQDLDELLEGLPQLFPLALDSVRDHSARAGIADPLASEALDVVAVGWSPKRGRMVGRQWWRQASPGGAFEAADIDPDYICVWHDSMRTLPEPRSAAAMALLAEAQCRALQEHEPDPRRRAGGRLIVAELARERMIIGPVCDLPRRST